MNGFLGGIYLTIAFGLLVFQFALFYKLWIMTGNIKELLVTNAELSAHVKILTKYFCEKEYIKFNHGVLALKGVTYTQDGSNVKFQMDLKVKSTLMWMVLPIFILKIMINYYMKILILLVMLYMIT